MFNSGFRGKRAGDSQGIINTQTKFIQNKYPVPTITSWGISGSDDTALAPAGGQTVLVNGSGFAAGCAVTVNGVTVTPVTVVNPSQISFTSPANSGGSYTLIVYNSTGGGAILVPGLVYSSVPTYTTAQGTIGSGYETTALSTSVVATSDSSITYTITAGALPSGASMTSGGVITGTYDVIASGTSSTSFFTVTATDAEMQEVTREFSLTSNIDVVSWVTPSSGATINNDGTAYSQALNATDAAGYAVSYSADTLPSGLTLSDGTISGTVTEEGTTSTILTATAATTNRTATNTITWVVSLNDTYFKYVSMLLSANSSIQTQSFVADNSFNNAQLIVAGNTKATNFNPYQVGYYSYQFNGSTDYFTLPVTTTLAFSGDYTIECWVYLNSVTGSQGVYSSIDNSGDSWQGPYIGFNGTSFLATSYIGSTDTITHQTTVAVGAWYHLAMVRFGSVTKSYLNGVQSTSTTTSTYSLTQSGGTIGSNYPGSGPLNGYISNLRVVTGAALYTIGFTPPTSPLTAIPNTVLLTGQSGTFVDNSPSVHALTLAGTPKSSIANPFTTVYQADTQYYSTNFDGTGDYITSAGNTALDMGTGDFTIECFVTTKGYAGSQYGRGIFALYPFGNYNKRLIVRHTTADNRLNIYAYDGSSTYFGSSGTDGVKALTAGLWYHIAFVRQSGVFRLYINGVQDIAVTNQTSVTLATSNCFDIGRTQEGSVPDWNGTISNFRVIKGTCLYPSGTTFIPPTSTLTAVSGTSLLTCQDSTIKDNSTNAIALTVTASAKPIPVTPFISTYYSTYFNATSTNYLSVGANAAFNLSTSDFSIEFWVRPISPAAYSALLSFDSTGDYPLCFYWGSSVNSGNILAAVGTTSAWFANTSAITFGTTTTGQWTHILLTRSGDTWRGFQDGVLRYYTSQSGTVGDCSTVYIGNNGTTATYRGAQSISNLRIIKGSIPTSYQTSSTTTGTTIFTPSSSPLTTTSQGATASDVSLLTCQSQYFVDNSLNNFTVTPGASPVTIPVAPFTQPSGYTSTQITTYGSGYFANTGASNTSWILGPTLPAFGTSDHTIEFWMYQVTSPQTYATAWRYAGGATQQATNDYYISTGASGGSILVGGGGSWTVSLSFTVPSNNAWHHYALTRSGTSWKIYVDGVLANTASGNPTLAAPGSAMVIASSAASAANGVYIQGYITDFRIVLGTVLYTSNFVPQFTSPLSNVTNTQLLTLQTNGSHNNSYIIDESRSNNIVTKNSNPASGTFSPYGDNWSVYFNGSTDYFSMPVATTTAMGSGFASSIWTLECWVFVSKYNPANYFCGILGSYAAVSANGRWALTVTGSAGGSGTPGFTYTTGTGSQNDRSSSITIGLGTWHHLAVTIDATTAATSTIKLYVNGQVGYSGSAENMSTQTGFYSAPLVGGGMGSGYWSYLNGYMSNVRIVKGTILYPSVFTPPTTPLVLGSYNTPMLVCSSNAFIDNSIVNATITTAGTPTIQKFSPFGTVTVPKYYSVKFDGNGDYIAAPVTNNLIYFPAGTDYTFEVWVYPTAAVTYQDIMGSYGSSSGTGRWLLYTESNGLTPVWYQYPSLNGVFSAAMTLNTWNHIAAVRIGGTTKGYLNGVERLTSNATYDLDGGTNNFWIGCGGTTRTMFNGYISNVRVVRGVGVYTGAFTPPTSPLSVTQSSGTNISAITGTQTMLLTCQSNTITDNSTNAYTLTAGNADPKPVIFSPFTQAVSNVPVSYSPTTFGGSLYLDGASGDFLTAPNTLSFDLSRGAWTIECWFYQIAAKTATLFSLGATRWRMVVFSTLGGHFYFNAASEMLIPAGTFVLNQWNHFSASCVGDGASNNVKLFANGKWITGGVFAPALDTTSTFYIGRNSDASGTSWDFNGYITDIRITRGKNLYNTSFAPPPAPLQVTQNTTFMVNGNMGVLDASRTVDLETVADAKVTNFSPYNGNYYSAAFSSTGIGASISYSGGSTGDITHELWIKPENTSRFWAFCPANGTNGIGISTESGYLNFWHNYFGSAGWTSNTPVSTGVWTHVAIVRKSTTIYFYINGVKQNTTFTSSTIPWQAAGTVGFGYYPNNNTQYNVGGVSNMRIVDGTAIYDTTQSTITVPTSPLTAITNTKLLVFQNNKFIDNSSSNFTITNTNASIQTSNPFQVNTGISYYLDGTGDYLASPVTRSLEFSSSDWTFETWVFPTGVSSQQSIVYLNANSSGYAALNLQIQSGALNLWMSSTGSAWSLQQGTIGSISAGVWTHIAITKSNTTMKVYINGSQAGGNYTVAQSLMTTYTVNQIGVYNTSSYLFAGYLTDLRITTGAVRTISVPTTPLKTN